MALNGPLERPPDEASTSVEDRCGAEHPRRVSVRCTLPAGHGPVTLSGAPFTHIDEEHLLAWLET